MFGKFLHERLRGRVLERLGMLDAHREPGFDRFVHKATRAYDAPIGLLTLLRGDELWIKAARGLDICSMPRGDAFCGHGVDRGGELLEVCDATLDPRFRDLPAVAGAPFVRYYIGAPLTSGGIDVGVLCVLDFRPRPPASADQRAYLVSLARLASGALESHALVQKGLAA